MHLPDDESLVERLRGDSQQAFEEIYHRYWLLLFSIAFKKIKSRENAKELVQELFLKLWSRRKQLVLHATLQAYLTSSLKKAIINYVQADLSKQARLTVFQQASAGPENFTESAVLLGELHQLLDEQIAQLPGQCGHIFRLSRYECWTHKEIAHQLNITTKTVENQINKALRLLKPSLSEYTNAFLPLAAYCLQALLLKG